MRKRRERVYLGLTDAGRWLLYLWRRVKAGEDMRGCGMGRKGITS